MGVRGGNKGGDEGLYLNHRLYWQLCLCVYGISSGYTGDQVTVVTVQKQEGGTICLLGRHVSNTILGTGYTSVDKTDTIYTPLNCFNLSMHIFPFQTKNNHLNNIERGEITFIPSNTIYLFKKMERTPRYIFYVKKNHNLYYTIFVHEKYTSTKQYIYFCTDECKYMKENLKGLRRAMGGCDE